MSEDSGSQPAPIVGEQPDAAASPRDQEMTATVAYPLVGGEQAMAAAPGADGESTLAIGSLLKHFRIVRLVGRGGMGDIYEAHDESLERTVAIKVIRAAQHLGRDEHAHLVHEARAQARINHPHVVQIYYVGLEPECPFLAMEFVRGTTLAERIRQSPLAFRDIVRISMQIIEALRRAAEMDIVHADIKPSNILLDETGSAKLTDFGLAQRNVNDDQRAAGLTGTPRYMAPEMLSGARSSVASDMYALGITLYELTLGRYPYSQSATTVQQQFDLHRSAEIAFPDPWPEQIPEGWKNLLGRLLAKDPEKRFADYGRLHAEMARFRPMTRLPAAILPRGMAWFLDLMLLAIVMVVIGLMQFALNRIPLGLTDAVMNRITSTIVNLVAAAVFGVLVYAHARLRTTPGKWLFQISIADQHGLPAPPLRLIPRLLLSQFPISLSLVFDFVSGLFGIELIWVGLTQLGLTGAWLAANIVSLVIDKRRLALHDRLLGTRAVIDHAM
jgi:hypothetical protein